MDINTQPITDVLQTKCKSCGGYMQYSPADEDLKCLYCGYKGGLDKTPVQIEENDFEYWKNRADEENKEEVIEIPEIKCRQCGATTTLPENTSAAKCAFCGTPLIMNEASVKRFWQPEYLLPFKVTEKASRENFKKWLGKKWFLPTQLKKYGTTTDSFKGVYLPFWTYDADTYTEYTGQRGKHRTEVSRNSKGEEVRRTVTDWYYTSGSVKVPFDDIVIPASKSLPDSILKNLTNWDMMNCVGYKKEFLAGFLTEIYQRDFREAIDDAKEKMDIVIEDSIKVDIGGDDQRIDSSHTEYNNIKFKHLLLPVWISAFKFNNKVYQFVVNGRTGRVTGQYPKDKTKIAMLVITIIAIIVALAMIF
ncbi:MAG: hypothetical protein PHP31_05175 [Lentimicrobiaceae bacterium]|nr:hypothetical protein [Lentimicrobiaceae bacterium]